MIFFYGSPFGENGPAQVNRAYVKCLPSKVLRIKSNNRFVARLEILAKILVSRVIIISALGFKTYETALAKTLGKKIIYIMHGLASDDGPLQRRLEADILPKANLILCVSSIFCKLARKRLPEYADKIDVLTNGIDWDELPDSTLVDDSLRKNNEIILVGGGRPIKRNLNICRAVEILNNEGQNYHISVFGDTPSQEDTYSISEFPFVNCYGLIPHKTLMEMYQQACLFIQVSESEPFGLAVIEALSCRCNILISANVGANEVFHPLPQEVVDIPADIEEIKTKLQWVINNPNRDRLLGNINRKSTSVTTSVIKLLRYVEKLCISSSNTIF